MARRRDRRPQLVRRGGQKFVSRLQRALEAGQHLLLLRVAAAHRGQLETGLHPDQQLASGERLDQEIVRAGFQPRDRLVLSGGA